MQFRVMPRALSAAMVLGVLVAGCSTAAPVPLGSAHGTMPERTPRVGATAESTLVAPPATPAPSPSSVRPEPLRRAESFDADHAQTLVARLSRLGPRDAVSPAYRKAAALVADEFRGLGYTVRLQPVPIPAGVSWGVSVPAGRSTNVVAEPLGFDPERPHVVLGAHLDTVPQSPGAEDNASGISVLLELSRMLQQQPARVPVRLVAFGGEESRGSGWRWYAFGSRHYVEGLSAKAREAIKGMVALDRVGRETRAVPVCHGGRGSTAVADDLRAAATVRTRACINRASDHVSFERLGITAARIGSVPYSAYHSSADTARVVSPGQLKRSGQVVWSWLRGL